MIVLFTTHLQHLILNSAMRLCWNTKHIFVKHFYLNSFKIQKLSRNQLKECLTSDPTCRFCRKHPWQVGWEHPRDVGRDQDWDRMVLRRTSWWRTNDASMFDAIPKFAASGKEIQHSTGGSNFEVHFSICFNCFCYLLSLSLEEYIIFSNFCNLSIIVM